MKLTAELGAKRDGRPDRRAQGLIVVAATIALLLVAAVGLQMSGQAGSRGARGEVGGLTYDLVIARSLKVSEGDLRAYGELSRNDSGLPIMDSTAYMIEGVDPDIALVVRLSPGAHDDAGPVGDYLLLLRGPVTSLCRFFDPVASATPEECR